MGSKLVSMVALSYILVLMLPGFATSNIDQDRAECADQVIALTTCLPYVGGDAKTPTIDCCTGLKQVLDKSKKCLCVLIKDRDDPSLGLNINTTIAATLPTACRSPTNVTECISLLHLAPNSPDAKIFQGFANLTQGHSTTPGPSVKGNSSIDSTIVKEKSDAGQGRRTPGFEMGFGVLACFFFTINLVSDM